MAGESKADKAKKKALEIAMRELPRVIDSLKQEPYYAFLPKVIYGPLVEAGLVVVNADIKNENGELAARPTELALNPEAAKIVTETKNEKENETMTTEATETAATAKPSFVIANVPMPEVAPKAHGGGVGREAIYPFAKLEVHQSFFVPATAEKPEPAKSLVSTAANAMRRFAEVEKNEDGTTKMKTVKSREKGHEGQTKEVPVTKNTRVFKVLEVEDGKDWGFPGVKGAGVWRTA